MTLNLLEPLEINIKHICLFFYFSLDLRYFEDVDCLTHPKLWYLAAVSKENLVIAIIALLEI